MTKSKCTGCGKSFTFDENCKEVGNGDLCPECTAQWEAEAEEEIRLQEDES